MTLISSKSGIPAFLTAFDPIDLPGGSVDPLGFEAGYVWLADRILPGLTVAGSAPRYISALCAGISLADTKGAHTDRERLNLRQDCQQRFERLWVAANTLASDTDNTPTDGIRGVTYARKALELHQGKKVLDADGYQLLAAQRPYGAVGIYASVSAGMRQFDRKTLRLSVEGGERLATAFLEETRCPPSVRQASRRGGKVTLADLLEWGRRSHINARTGDEEARQLCDALAAHPTRLRMTRRLEAVPGAQDEHELQRLKRIAASISDEDADIDLQQAIRAILAFELSYQHLLFVLERVLWMCRSSMGGPKTDWASIEADRPLRDALESLAEVDVELRASCSVLEGQNLARILECVHAAAKAQNTPELVAAVMGRHGDVQRNKRVGGRPKMPWVELDEDGASLTLTEVGGLRHEVTSPSELSPHQYRTTTADNLRNASHGTEVMDG